MTKTYYKPFQFVKNVKKQKQITYRQQRVFFAPKQRGSRPPWGTRQPGDSRPTLFRKTWRWERGSGAAPCGGRSSGVWRTETWPRVDRSVSLHFVLFSTWSRGFLCRRRTWRTCRRGSRRRRSTCSAGSGCASRVPGRCRIRQKLEEKHTKKMIWINSSRIVAQKS